MASDVKLAKVPWTLIIVFLLLSVGIGTSGYFYYQNQKEHIKTHMEEELSAIANLKVDQISSWLNERIKNVTMPSQSPFFITGIRELLNNPSDPIRRKRVLNFMASFKEAYGFQNSLLLDQRQSVLLSSPEGGSLDCPHFREKVDESFHKRQIILTDLHQAEKDGRIHIGIIAPVKDPEGAESIPIAILVFVIDPRQFLYPLIQSWPVRSQTSETLLVRREGDEVVFLNELRHQKNTALNLRLPMHKKHLPAAMAVRGKEGTVVGLDYREVPVIAVIRRIPASSWFLIAKVDQEEVYAPIRASAKIISMMVGLLIAGSGIILGLLWAQQKAQDYKKQAKIELRHLALLQRLAYLTKYANDIILLIDQGLKIVEWNERALSSYGYTNDEMVQLNLKELRPPELRVDLETQIKQIERSNGLIYETVHRRKDGTIFPVEVSSRAVEVEGKKYYQSIIRDITDRKRAEEALRSEKAWSELIVNLAPNIIVGLDEGSRILIFNKFAEKLTGYKTEEVLGKPWIEIFIPEKIRGQIYNVWDEILGNQLIEHHFENPIVTKYGEEKIIAWNNTILTSDGQFKMVLSVGEDITERKRAEREMTALQEQLRQSQKMEAIGQLAGGIAHDFNNLLTIISGSAQLSLLDLQEGDPVKSNLEEIRRASERAADLTRQLLAFSRKQIMEMKVLDLNQALQRLDKMLRRVIGEDIALDVITAGRLGKVKADPGQMEQILINLVVNARDAMPEGGKLTIETANVELDEEYAHRHIAVKPGRYVMLSVSDTGKGIAPEIRERIFEPFFTTKEVGKGTGLGLSTVYGIVKQTGGNIWVYSEPGRGTIFKIYLPVVDEPLEELEAEVVREIPGGSETVLVVEDEETVRKLAVRILKRQGYNVQEAEDGSKALMLCEGYREPIHLIVTDVVMPGMTGRQLAERLSGIHPEAKVLFMSGYTDNAIAHHGVLESGVNFLQKPFTLESLARKVRDTLDKY